jgi:hypothetical protein
MDREAAEAMIEDGYEPLAVSIHKWRDVVYGRGYEDGADNCALCIVYCGCDECPVCEEVGRSMCLGTPYSEITNHYDDEHDGHFVRSCEECLRLAKKELLFLEKIATKRGTIFTKK